MNPERSRSHILSLHECSYAGAFQAEHIQRVHELVCTGLQAQEQVIGYHGTSLSALRIAMQTGYLPTGRSPGNEGHIYFFPLRASKLTCEGFEQWELEDDEADLESLDLARGYAVEHSVRAHTAQMLGLDLSAEEVWNFMGRISDRDDCEDLPEDEFARLGLDKNRVLHVLHPARHAGGDTVRSEERGFILLLGRKAIERHSYHLGDHGYGDMKIHVEPPGLSLDCLVGIHALCRADGECITMLMGPGAR